MSGYVTELLLIGMLLLLNGLLAMAEMAIVSARKGRLRARATSGDAGAAAALALAAEPTRFLSTVQIGITLIGILLGAVSGATIAADIRSAVLRVPPLSAYAQPLSLAIVVGATTFLSLVIGELVPKRIAQIAPEVIASHLARPLRLFAALTSPLVSILTLTTEGVLRLLGVRTSGRQSITEDDVRLLIAQGAESGVIQPAERDIVEGAFALGDRAVQELMTPRPRVTWLDLDAAQHATLARIAAAPHRAYPASHGDLDNVAGVIALKDVAVRLLKREQTELTTLLRPALFVPETLPAYEALDRFKESGTRIALVVDEFGVVVGLLTATDLLEVLAGDKASEHEAAPAGAARRARTSRVLDGLTPLHEAYASLGLPAETEQRDEAQTLGGVAMARIGRIPVAGDRFQWRGLSFEVVDMDGRRVDKLMLLDSAGISSGQPD
jgi:putative hemolysin